MPKTLLTATFVASASCPEGARKIDWFDTRQPGLLLEQRASGGQTWYCRYQDDRGRTRQLRLGSTRELTLHQARALAGQARSQVRLGHDLARERHDQRHMPTLAEFVHERYLTYVKTYKRSWATDECLLRLHILPRLGHCRLDDISRRDVMQLHAERRQAGAATGTANRLLVLLRYIYNLALRWEVPGVTRNPAAGVPLFQANRRERYLQLDETERLLRALRDSDNPMLQFIVPGLLLTGARKRELLDARWEHLDMVSRRWLIPLTKSGKPRHVPISDAFLTVLRRVPRFPDCPWVFPNPRTLKPFVSIYYAWHTARLQAGLPDVVMHDMRHSFASFLINNGRSLYEVSRILGHTQVSTTQRYSHLADSTLLAAANVAGAQIPVFTETEGDDSVGLRRA